MIVRFGTLTFDSSTRQVVGENGAAVHLTRKAFDLLALLIAEAPRVVHKSEIHERLWPGVFVTDATVVGLVKELRRALQDRDSRAPVIRTSHGIGYAFCLAVQKSPEPRSTGEHWIVTSAGRTPLNTGENLIGRDPAAAVWLDIAGVSRRHARIVIDGQQARLEDLGSKNGTMVRGDPLMAATVVHDGDPIRIGPVRITYRFFQSEMSTETTARTASRKGDDTGT